MLWCFLSRSCGEFTYSVRDYTTTCLDYQKKGIYICIWLSVMTPTKGKCLYFSLVEFFRAPFSGTIRIVRHITLALNLSIPPSPLSVVTSWNAHWITITHSHSIPSVQLLSYWHSLAFRHLLAKLWDSQFVFFFCQSLPINLFSCLFARLDVADGRIASVHRWVFVNSIVMGPYSHLCL